MDHGTRGWARFGPLFLLGAVGAVLAVAVFGVPLGSVLLVGLLLLCPLMMVGMHGGGRGHHDMRTSAQRHVEPAPNRQIVRPPRLTSRPSSKDLNERDAGVT